MREREREGGGGLCKILHLLVWPWRDKRRLVCVELFTCFTMHNGIPLTTALCG